MASKAASKRSTKTPSKPKRAAAKTASSPQLQTGFMHPCFIIMTRVLLGFMMLWAFLDKLFGLRFSTSPENAWLAGGSPTTGFLTHSTAGPFAGLFQSLAGIALVDWLFMLGLLGVGVAFMLGIKTRLAGWAGALMMAFMFLSNLPPATNPLITYHVVFAVLFVGIGYARYTHRFDIVRSWWLSLPIVKDKPWLE